MSTTENNVEKNESGGRFRLIGIAYLIVYVCVLNGLCMQFIVYRMAHHPALDASLLAHACSPFAWQDWMFKFYGCAPGSYNYAFIFFALGTPVGILAYVLWVGFESRSSRKYDDVHGTTHSATHEEVQETGLLPREGKTGQGVYCGVYDDAETGKIFYLRHDSPEHVLALAPTRSGKDVDLVIPTLLSWPHSVSVPDRKDENYAMTSGQRQKYANSVILCFDLAKSGTGYVWNPFGEIQYRTRFQVSGAQSIAIMVVDSDGKGVKSDRFRSVIFELLVGLILHMLYKGDQIGHTPCLQDIGHMLTGVGDFTVPDATNDLADNPDGDLKVLAGLFDEMCGMHINDGDPANREAQIIITGVGTHIANIPTHESGNIISTASNTFALYHDPIVGENTPRSDFKIAGLMDHDRPVPLYLISTPKTPKRPIPLTRPLLTMIVLTMANEMELDDGRAKTVHKRRLSLMLDKFPMLGRIEVSEEALAYIAGYGMKAHIIMQDVSQLYRAYTREESIISNCHVRVAYAPNRLETAEWMSKMAGNTAVVKKQMITPGKQSGAVLDNVSRSYQEVKHLLMEPDEIMRLLGPVRDASGKKIVETGEMLVLVVGHSVVRGRQILYPADPVFSKRSKLKPIPTDMMRKVPGQPAAIAPVPEDEAVNQRRDFIVSRLNAASESPLCARPG